jgi:hypothetical protein
VYAERKGFVLPGFAWAGSEAVRRMCWAHRQLRHPGTLYFDWRAHAVAVITREELSEIVNQGADIITSELGGEAESDLANLVVNAVMTLVDLPKSERESVTFEDVIAANYDASPNEVRGWWSW